MAAVLASLLLFSGSALATPLEQTLDLAGLRAKLDASPDGVVAGYMKTVLRGSKIETIPVDIIAVTSPSSGLSEEVSSLIMFEAKGSAIEKLGGIASGMSGSPIFVDVEEGEDELVGALAYGDWFTLAGTGLATPIGAMTAIEDEYAANRVIELSQPVLTDEGPVNQLLLTPDPDAARTLDVPGTLVAKPLSALTIGGLRPNSAGFEALSERLEKRGFDVVPLSMTLGASKDTFTTTMTGGAAVGAMASRGDVWVGGLGTVTYANEDNVLAFGHPMLWSGESGLQLTNAWIDGVWPSSVTPYKIGVPGAVRGVVTQDRAAGVMGVLGAVAEEAVVTARVTNLDTGKVGTSTTYVPSWALDVSDELAWIPGAAAYTAASRAFDQWAYKGSASTTTTIEVSDGEQSYEIVRTNVFDDSMDVPSVMVMDVEEMMYEFNSAVGNGFATTHIVSVDFEASFTKQRNLATIVDVQAPDGLKYGTNVLKVGVLRHGIAATQTVDVLLDIPVGTPLAGEVVVFSAAGGMFEPESDEEPGDRGEYMYGPDRRTTADIVNGLRTASPNSEIVASFFPEEPEPEIPDEEYPGEFSMGMAIPESIEGTAGTSWYITGGAVKSATSLTARASARTIAYNGTVSISGIVEGIYGAKGGDVAVYGRYPGETVEHELVRVPVNVMMGGTFTAPVKGLQKNTALTVRYLGDADTLGSKANLNVNVMASVIAKPSVSTARAGTNVTLSATMLPSGTAGNVVFEVLRYNKWTAVGTRAISADKASMTWKSLGGTTQVRARYVAPVGAPNVSATSKGVSLVVK